MIKIGDTVKFTTPKPDYCALFSRAKLRVMGIADDGALTLKYPKRRNFTQVVSPKDVKVVK